MVGVAAAIHRDYLEVGGGMGKLNEIKVPAL
jgi:hypothetical protein